MKQNLIKFGNFCLKDVLYLFIPVWFSTWFYRYYSASVIYQRAKYTCLYRYDLARDFTGTIQLVSFTGVKNIIVFTAMIQHVILPV
jgi:hypothetical protein